MRKCVVCGIHPVVTRPGAEMCAICAVFVLSRLFAILPLPETGEEIDRELRDLGLDPDEMTRQGAKIARRALDEFQKNT